jgi:hypothetical protein
MIMSVKTSTAHRKLTSSPNQQGKNEALGSLSKGHLKIPSGIIKPLDMIICIA